MWGDPDHVAAETTQKPSEALALAGIGGGSGEWRGVTPSRRERERHPSSPATSNASVPSRIKHGLKSDSI
jgi:hypothetical protein